MNMGIPVLPFPLDVLANTRLYPQCFVGPLSTSTNTPVYRCKTKNKKLTCFPRILLHEHNLPLNHFSDLAW